MPDGGALVGTSRGLNRSATVAEGHYAPFLVRLGPDREVVWADSVAARQHWDAFLWDLAATPDGGAVVVASTQGLVGPEGDRFWETSGLVVAVGPDGAERWTYRVDSFRAGDTMMLAVAVGPDGVVYVVGHDRAPISLGRVVLRALSPNGDLLWATTLNGSDRVMGSGQHVAVRPGGGVIVVGQEYDPNRSFSTTTRTWAVDADGSTVWTAGFGGGEHPSVWAQGLTVGPDGSVYVVGQSTNYEAGGSVVLAYGPDGTERWVSASAEGPPPPEGWYAEAASVASALSPDGDLVVVGHRQEGAEGLRPFLVRYAPDGSVRWRVRAETRPYPLPTCSEARAFDVVVGARGEAYIVSAVGGPLGAIQRHPGDVLVQSFSAEGEWTGGALQRVGDWSARYDLALVGGDLLVTGDMAGPFDTFVVAFWFDVDGVATAAESAPGEVDTSGPLVVWPNPASTVLRVTPATGVRGTVDVFDMLGRQVLTVPAAEAEAGLDVRTLTPGTYVVRANGKGAVFTVRR